MSANDNAGNEQVMPDGASDGQRIQVHVSPELEYSYRDFFSLYVGMEEVVLELGNRHRGQPRATIQNHVVLSIPNAIRLQQALGRSLEEARKRVQEAQQQAAEKKSDAKKK